MILCGPAAWAVHVDLSGEGFDPTQALVTVTEHLIHDEFAVDLQIQGVDEAPDSQRFLREVATRALRFHVRGTVWIQTAHDEWVEQFQSLLRGEPVRVVRVSPDLPIECAVALTPETVPDPWDP